MKFIDALSGGNNTYFITKRRGRYINIVGVAENAVPANRKACKRLIGGNS